VFKQTNAGATFVIAGITLLAGVYFPVALLPDWISWLSEVQPFTPAVELLRHLISGTPSLHSPLVDVLKLMGWVVVLLPVSLRLLAAAIGYSRRRGTIIEY
jgi:ABC-2 type transport system permease protein